MARTQPTRIMLAVSVRLGVLNLCLPQGWQEGWDLRNRLPHITKATGGSGPCSQQESSRNNCSPWYQQELTKMSTWMRSPCLPAAGNCCEGQRPPYNLEAWTAAVALLRQGAATSQTSLRQRFVHLSGYGKRLSHVLVWPKRPVIASAKGQRPQQCPRFAAGTQSGKSWPLTLS